MRAIKIFTAVLFTALSFTSAVRGQAQTASEQALVAGRAAIKQQHYAEAIQLLESELKNSPSDQNLKLELGRAYLL